MHLSIALIPSCHSLTGERRRFFQVWEEHGVLCLPIIDICEYVKLLYFFERFIKIYLSLKKLLRMMQTAMSTSSGVGTRQKRMIPFPLPSPPPMLFALFTISFKFLTVLYPKRRQNYKINTSYICSEKTFHFRQVPG